MEKTLRCNKRVILLRLFCLIFSLIIVVSTALLPVSASTIIGNSGLSYMMAFAGSDNTGLNYSSSGFIEYSINDSYILESASSVGTFTTDSFLSSVYYLKNTDGTYILHEGDSFKYSFSNFSFVIESGPNSYRASKIEAKVIFTYDDDTTLVVQPDFDFNSTLDTITLFGEADVTKNVKDIKLDCKFYPSTVGLTGYMGYYYYMWYPPDVYIELDSEESQILGDIDNKLEELPDKVGDEFESVIDQEKEESKQEGNKFVDQVLDKLPDPSQGVLSALGELTSAVGYTGTEAVIPFPAIVVPGIEGLFDEIVIYDGSDFDLGSCVSYIPENILTVIQSLFTIAIVLYCVYELKGIISFIFTLKEKNNG